MSIVLLSALLQRLQQRRHKHVRQLLVQPAQLLCVLLHLAVRLPAAFRILERQHPVPVCQAAQRVQQAALARVRLMHQPQQAAHRRPHMHVQPARDVGVHKRRAAHERSRRHHHPCARVQMQKQVSASRGKGARKVGPTKDSQAITLKGALAAWDDRRMLEARQRAKQRGRVLPRACGLGGRERELEERPISPWLSWALECKLGMHKRMPTRAHRW